jgi:Kef-type K+ transport system membrane component KefB/predicted amino acid-binding ACT domain protein
VDVGEVLLHILVVLLAAKVGAEVAERLSIPPVLGEIVAGLLVGSSVLGLVGNDEVLRVLGELGVILLLLQVGLEMDLGELGSVGRASLSVATVGVIVPFATGIVTGLAFGMSGNEALFVGAALTATSVGITARVFGDLRALASVEARTVLGAAVADDVIGLVILTVVTRIVSEGSVSLLSLGWIIVVAVGFLVVTTVVGIRIAPPLFAVVTRHSRSSGTLVAVALAFTLAIAELADAAKLAPIVGAFVAGLVLARTTPAERIRRELTPVSHLLVPVFFLQIGIDADIGQFIHGKVLALAGALLVVAIVGKLASIAGMWGSAGDRLLVGIGMIPRGEVGLIFATLGLRQGVFGDDVYAALLLVVLVTTVATPPALRQRLLQLRKRRQPNLTGADGRPEPGWLVERDHRVELVAEPAPGLTLEVALEAAVRCAATPPGDTVLDWLAELPGGPLRWTRPARSGFVELLERGTARSWRLLIVTGVLERSLPELGAAVERRQGHAELDPLAALHWDTLTRLRERATARSLEHPDRVLLAALVLDATDESDAVSPVVVARKTCQRLDVGAAAEQAVAGLVSDAGLLAAASRRIDGLDEEAVLQVAAHLATPERARALFLLTLARMDLAPDDRTRLATLHDLIQAVLGNPELVGRAATNAIEQRRAQAERLVGDDTDARERIQHAPRAYLLRVAPADIARQVRLCDPVPSPRSVRVGVSAVEGRSACWWVDVVARDRPGLLARETGVLTAQGANIEDAVAVTWGDGCALASFLVDTSSVPQPDVLQSAIDDALGHPLSSTPLPDVTLDFDDDASPWHTVCTARAVDRRGLLHSLTTAFAAAGANVHAARVRRDGTAIVGVFELTGGQGRKLGAVGQDAVRDLLGAGVMERRPRWGRTRRTRTITVSRVASAR